MLVADSPAVGGAEATNDPAIFYRRLKKSYGVLIVGGAGAGARAYSGVSRLMLDTGTKGVT